MEGIYRYLNENKMQNEGIDPAFSVDELFLEMVIGITESHSIVEESIREMELVEAATMINEGAKVLLEKKKNGFISAIIKFFKDLAQRVSNYVSKIISSITSKEKKYKKFLEENEKKLKEIDGSKDLELKGRNIDKGTPKAMDKRMTNNMAVLEDASKIVESAVSVIVSQSGAIERTEAIVNWRIIEDALKEFVKVDKFKEKIGFKEGMKMDEFLYEYCKMDSEVKELKGDSLDIDLNIDLMKESIQTFSDIKSIKKIESRFKKNIGKANKALSVFENHSKSGVALRKMVNLMKGYQLFISTMMTTQIKVASSIGAQAHKVLVAQLKAAKSK